MYIIQNLDYFTGEEKLIAEIDTIPNITPIKGSVVTALLGEDSLTGIRIQHGDDLETIKIDGMFTAIGLIPELEPFNGLIKVNSYGYADSNESCTTNVKGIFVAGDCRSKRIRQVATAVSDGAIAALNAVDYIKSL